MLASLVRRRAPRAALAAPLLAVALAACHDPVAPPAEDALTALPRPLTGRESAVVAGSNDFAFAFLREVARAQPATEDVFVSPLSVSMAFGMLMNGTAGESQAQVRRTLGLGEMGLEDANAASHDLIALLRGIDRGVDFRIANSTWARTGFPVRPEFHERVRAAFDAESRTMDFASPATLAAINDWVKAATNGKIETILDEISPDMVMYLINAIYFKGSWRSRFDAAQTVPAPFTSADGRVQSVPSMRQTHAFAYHREPGFRAVDLPYGRGAFTMTVILPDSGSSPDAVLARLDAAAWARLVEFRDTTKVALQLPKFRLSRDYDLEGTMQALGVRDVFSDASGDFTPLSPATGLYVSQVKHKTFVDVHEEGTEAAAVTSIGFGVTSVPQVVDFVVDRPFLFVIRERFSGVILFMGRISTIPV